MSIDVRRLCAVLSAIACFALPPIASAEDATTPREACEKAPQAARADCLAAAALLMKGSPEPVAALTVRIEASAGKLAYRYEVHLPSENGSADFRECTATDMLTLPVGTGVRLLLTARDDVHTWRIPPLDITSDLVPGRVNEVLVQPIAGDMETEGLLLDEQSGIERRTKILVTDKVQDKAGRLSLEALCGE